MANVQQLSTEEDPIAAVHPALLVLRALRVLRGRRRGARSHCPRSLRNQGSAAGSQYLSPSLALWCRLEDVPRHLLLVRKLRSQWRVNAVTPGRLLPIKDDIYNRRFIKNTGASYSVFPYTSTLPPLGPCLKGTYLVLGGQDCAADI